jgi:hypothetical protein
LINSTPQGFHKVRYYGLWHAFKRRQAQRAWVLLMLERPAATASEPRKRADLLPALGQLAQAVEATFAQNGELDAEAHVTRRAAAIHEGLEKSTEVM